MTFLAVAACVPPGPDADDADKASFRRWSAQPANAASIQKFTEYLDAQGVGDIFPAHQLLRSDVQWQKCGAEPFTVPPKAFWPNIVPTLRLIRDNVEPLVGPVEAQSVFRGSAINRCIKGASRSYHLSFHAIDMRPTNGTARKELIEKLCALHARKGEALNMGLGIYSGTRFHIDTAGYRRWGHDHTASSSPCASFVAPQRKNR